jgi:pimeloyl-ACP methyl ester carboxylesterase
MEAARRCSRAKRRDDRTTGRGTRRRGSARPALRGGRRRDARVRGRGHRTAVVCLHAIGHGAARLRAPADGSARHPSRARPRLAGAGRSGVDRRRPMRPRYAQLLEGFLVATGAEHPVLVGNSIGGAAAIRHAYAHPRDVAGWCSRIPAVWRRPTIASPKPCSPPWRVLRRRPACRALVRTGLRRLLPQRLQRGARGRSALGSSEPHTRWRHPRAGMAQLRVRRGGPACHGRRHPVSRLVRVGHRDQVVALSRSMPAIRRFPRARLERSRPTRAASRDAGGVRGFDQPVSGESLTVDSPPSASD